MTPFQLSVQGFFGYYHHAIAIHPLPLEVGVDTLHLRAAAIF